MQLQLYIRENVTTEKKLDEQLEKKDTKKKRLKSFSFRKSGLLVFILAGKQTEIETDKHWCKNTFELVLFMHLRCTILKSIITKYKKELTLFLIFDGVFSQVDGIF